MSLKSGSVGPHQYPKVQDRLTIRQRHLFWMGEQLFHLRPNMLAIAWLSGAQRVKEGTRACPGKSFSAWLHFVQQVEHIYFL